MFLNETLPRFTRRRLMLSGGALALYGLSMSNSIAADSKTSLLEQAFSMWSSRGSDPDGLSKVRKLIALLTPFTEGTQAENADDSLMYARILLAASYAFLGFADKSTPAAENYLSGYKQAIFVNENVFGVNRKDSAKAQASSLANKYSDAKLDILARSLTLTGVTLAGWAQAEGPIPALTKFPEIRFQSELLEAIDRSDTLYYTLPAIMGRFYMLLPSMAGGDLNKAQRLLKHAFDSTQIEGANCSASGLINLFYPDILHQLGDDEKAKSIANAFVQRPLDQFPFETRPENIVYKVMVTDDVKGW